MADLLNLAAVTQIQRVLWHHAASPSKMSPAPRCRDSWGYAIWLLFRAQSAPIGRVAAAVGTAMIKTVRTTLYSGC
jgi:hypothetical protein